MSPLTVRGDLVHHFVRVDVDREQMRMTVIDIEGKAIDKFALKMNADGTIGSDVEQPVDREHAEKIIAFFTSLSPFKRPETLIVRREANEIVIDFATLPCGELDTSEYPAEFRVKISGAKDCVWKVTESDIPIRGRRELRIAAKPPVDSAPLRLRFQPLLGKRKLIPHTFEVIVEETAR